MTARRRFVGGLVAGAVLAAALGWLLCPVLREAVAYVTLALGRERALAVAVLLARSARDS